MLKIKNLIASKELDSKAMASVRGGFDPFAILVDGSTTLKNKVADVDQQFYLGLAQNNAGAVTNNQAIQGGNGIIDAPVDQHLKQKNNMSVYDIGNVYVD
ncbi:MAG: hypothetical protein P8Y45_22560 [Exilibacterium sp.]